MYKDVARRAEDSGWAYRDFLALLVSEEVAHRERPMKLSDLVSRPLSISMWA
jgi:hypothetical protein